MIAYTIYLDLGPTLIQNQTVIAESTFPLVVHSIIVVMHFVWTTTTHTAAPIGRFFAKVGWKDTQNSELGGLR